MRGKAQRACRGVAEAATKTAKRLMLCLWAGLLAWTLAGGSGVSGNKDSNQFIYVQRLSHERVVVAWGGPGGEGKNTIGESSPSFGPAELHVFYYQNGNPIPGSPFRAERQNWFDVPLPAPATEYQYDLLVNGKRWGDRLYREERLLRFESFPHPSLASGLLSFLVLGDFGTGKEEQFRLAETMSRVVDERDEIGRPIRFVLTTGDNIYDESLFWGTTSDDNEFYKKLFLPYQRILSRVPFFPALGNHDGSESERTKDLLHYRDNFFLPQAIFPDGTISAFADRFYAFSYGTDVKLFCLDTTTNRETIPNLSWTPIYGGEGGSEQRHWLEGELQRASEVSWKIAWFHHPPMNAGRGHYQEENLVRLRSWLTPSLARGGVRVAFSGHVHNFQITRNEASGTLHQTRYFVTGAGGKSERGRNSKKGLLAMTRERIEATNVHARVHFLLVDIDGDRMQVWPLTYDQRTGRPAPLAIRTATGTEYEGAAFTMVPTSSLGSNGGDKTSPYHPIRILAQPRDYRGSQRTHSETTQQ